MDFVTIEVYSDEAKKLMSGKVGAPHPKPFAFCNLL